MQSWVQALNHEGKKSLAMLLCFVLVKELSFTETKSAKLTATVIDKNEKTVRCWRTNLIKNGGEFSKSRYITREMVCCGKTKNSTKRH